MFTFLKKNKIAKENAEAELHELEHKKFALTQEIEKLTANLTNIQVKHDSLSADIEQAMDKIRLIETGFGVLEEIGYERYVPTGIDEFTESHLFEYEAKMAEMLSNGNAYITTREYRINNSAAQGQRFQKNYVKNLLTGFMNTVKPKFKSVTENNYYNYCGLIEKTFAKYNKQGELLGITLNQEFLDTVEEVLQYTLDIKILKAKEKARFREERRRMREQEKLLEEIAKEEERLEKERKSMDIAFAKALTDTERTQIKAKMNKIDKRMDDLKYRKEHNNAGWLYVISSPSLPNMCKVGCTRRLNPTIRVKELSSASLPYAFRTHGFVFSDNCFELETQMHHYFDDKRVAPDREFFYITPQEAIDVLKNRFKQEVHFEDVEDCNDQD